MSLGHGASIVRDGLVLHLDAASVRSYPGSGTTVSDLSSNAFSGTLTNGCTVSNGAFQFDGVDEYVDLGDAVDITGPFSLNVWFKGNASQPDSYVGLLNKSGNGDFGNYGLYGDGSSSYVRFGFVSSSAQREVSNTSYNDIKANTWVNYCGTYDQTNLKLYRNGVLIASASQTETPLATNDTLSLGGRVASSNYFFSGEISVGQIYDRDLTLDEIQQNFNALRGRYGI